MRAASRRRVSLLLPCAALLGALVLGCPEPSFAQQHQRVLVPESPVILVNDPPPAPPAPDAIPARPGEQPREQRPEQPEGQAPRSGARPQVGAAAPFGQKHDIDPHMSNKEVLLSGVIGAGTCGVSAVVAGAITGITIFFVVENQQNPDDFTGDDAIVYAAFGGLGASVIACTTSASAAVHAYGNHIGHQGSIGFTVLGAMGGLLAGVVGLIIPFFNYISIPVMTGAGATFGYMMSNRMNRQASPAFQAGGGAGAPVGFTVRF